MNLKNQLLGLGSAVLILFSSCKKDLVAPEEQPINADAVSSNLTANDVPETAAPIGTPITTYVNANSAGYYEVLPARYHLTTKTYPLILFIHGIGELGTGVTRLTCCGLPAYVYQKKFPAEFIVNGQHFSFIVVAPQFKVRPSAADMQSAIDYAVKKYRVDQSRIYITGLSMGGGSAWDYSAVYGQRVAAAVPVCGGTAPTTALAKAIASKNLPVWTISSTADAVVPISWARNWIAWIKADNPANAINVKLTEYTSGESHNTTWSKAFNPGTIMDGYNIYQWMLKYQRSGTTIITPPVTAPPPTTTPPPTSPTGNIPPIANAGADDAIKLSWNFSPLLNGNYSKDPDGWLKSITWTKIGGPPTYTIANPNVGNTRVTFTAPGTYVFRVTVTDNLGAVSTDTKQIVVSY